MEFRVGVGEWNCRFFVSKFLTRIPRARSSSPRSGCPSRGEAQRRVTAAQAGLAIRSEPSRANASAERRRVFYGCLRQMSVGIPPRQFRRHSTDSATQSNARLPQRRHHPPTNNHPHTSAYNERSDVATIFIKIRRF